MFLVYSNSSSISASVPSRNTNVYCWMRPLCKPRISSLVALAPQARKSKKPSTT